MDFDGCWVDRRDLRPWPVVVGFSLECIFDGRRYVVIAIKHGRALLKIDGQP